MVEQCTKSSTYFLSREFVLTPVCIKVCGEFKNGMQQKKVKNMKQFILNFMVHEYT
jgi:uncharacterized metal-binding protein